VNRQHFQVWDSHRQQAVHGYSRCTVLGSDRRSEFKRRQNW